MAQNDVYGLRKVVWAIEDVPLGLSNPRRIWELIQDIISEEASAGDLEADPWDCE